MVALALLSLAACKNAPGTETPGRNCGSADHYAQAIKNPAIQKLDQELEVAIAAYGKEKGNDDVNTRGERIRIPVVVHVLHNGEAHASNISDAQIQSQIDAMNQYFRATNADISGVPAAWNGLIRDSRIEFQLARRTPTCEATNGITRQRAGNVFYTSSLEDAKSTAAGGVDPWDTDAYLNIWVVEELRNGAGRPLLGYSSFPSDPANEQGFVSEHRYFGTNGTGTSDPSFAMGKTAVHEFGHFFNLRHIWGDDDDNSRTCESPAECNGSDQVGDTPNQGERNYGTPAFPLTDCCTADSPGVMFINYMDYTDDPGMIMFTNGQVDRMLASLYTTKASLIGSYGLYPPGAGAAADLLMLDTPEDMGNEPNNESTVFYQSEDIWVRNGNDGRTNQEHQNPAGGAGNNVYVRVRNKGCANSAAATLKLYWAKASAGLSWENPWTGAVSMGGVVMGGIIGEQPIPAVAGGEFSIFEFPWNAPNPADYAALGGDRSHFCLLARIEEAGGMTTPETADLHENVKANNNIAWKNVTISSPAGGGGREAYASAANFGEKAMETRIAFEDVRGEASLFQGNQVYAELDPVLYKKWVAGGRVSQSIEDLGENKIQILKPGAFIDKIPLKYKEIYAIRVYTTPTKAYHKNTVYFLNLTQYNAKRLVGGQVLIF